MNGSLAVASVGLVISFIFSGATWLRQRRQDRKVGKKDDRAADLEIIRETREGLLAENARYRTVVVPGMQADLDQRDARIDELEEAASACEREMDKQRREWLRERADLVRDNDSLRRHNGVLQARAGGGSDDDGT